MRVRVVVPGDICHVNGLGPEVPVFDWDMGIQHVTDEITRFLDWGFISLL